MTGTETKRTITEEVAFRTGFLEGVRAALGYIPRFLDRGLPLADVVGILDRWTDKLDRWAREAATADFNGNSAPPTP